MSAISNFLNQIKTAIYGEQVRDAIHDSILQCYTDVTNAKTLADQSTTSANNAAASANSAATKANNAASSANSAAQSATTAANNANAAANNASNAKEAANSAAQVATSAANQANDAATAANTAKTNADTATKAANTAAGAANTAAEAANTAATNANTAKDDAVAATEAVNAAAETINGKGPGVVENANGAIASFSDGSGNVPVKKLEINIEPVQDLHGYDNPWPGGGGKNILNITEGTKTTNGVTFTVNADKTITLSGIVSDTNDAVFKQNLSVSDFPSDTIILNGCPSGGNYYNKYSMALCDIGGRLINNKSDVGSGVEYSAEMLESASQLQIIVRKGTDVNGLVFKPMIRLATETDDTFVPYSNICPIEGWTGVKVTRVGNNLFDKANVQSGYFTTNFTEAGGALSDRYRSDYIKVAPSTPYHFDNIVPASATTRGVWYDKYKTPIRGVNFMPSSSTSGTDTAPENAAYLRAVCYKTNVDAFMISIGSTAMSYEPYQGETYDISLPSEAGTVYGGSLNVATGELTVDWIQHTFDGSETEWGKVAGSQSGYAYFRCIIGNYGDVTGDEYSISDTLPNTPITSINRSIGFRSVNSQSGNGAYIAIRLTNEDWTLQDFKAYLSEHPIFIVWKITTPLTYHLTPTQVKTLLGQNNIWADAGDVSVDYIADTKLYIDKKFTELQALVLENVGG